MTATRAAKSNWFRLATQLLCTCITPRYISLPSLHNYDVKRPSFTLHGGRGQDKTILFLFLNLDTVPLKSTLEEFPNIKQIVWNGERVINFETARIYFQSDIFTSVASLHGCLSSLLAIFVTRPRMIQMKRHRAWMRKSFWRLRTNFP